LSSTRSSRGHPGARGEQRRTPATTRCPRPDGGRRGARERADERGRAGRAGKPNWAENEAEAHEAWKNDFHFYFQTPFSKHSPKSIFLNKQMTFSQDGPKIKADQDFVLYNFVKRHKAKIPTDFELGLKS
jgi:hypothetical protein